MKNPRITYFLQGRTRESIHEEIIKLFLAERHGPDAQGKKMEYEYEVDSFGTYKIILQRPARLNHGMDFLITTDPSIDFYRFKKGTFRVVPAQKDIFDFLLQAKDSNGVDYSQIKDVIRRYLNCDQFTLPAFNFCLEDKNGNSFPIEVVLLLIKWFFIEQDVTYWNYTGRAMLFKALQEQGLA